MSAEYAARYGTKMAEPERRRAAMSLCARAAADSGYRVMLICPKVPVRSAWNTASVASASASPFRCCAIGPPTNFTPRDASDGASMSGVPEAEPMLTIVPPSRMASVDDAKVALPTSSQTTSTPRGAILRQLLRLP